MSGIRKNLKDPSIRHPDRHPRSRARHLCRTGLHRHLASHLAPLPPIRPSLAAPHLSSPPFLPVRRRQRPSASAPAGSMRPWRRRRRGSSPERAPVATAAVGFGAGGECAAMTEAAAWLLPGASSRSDSLPRASRRRMRRSAIRARSWRRRRRRPVGHKRDGGGAAAQTMRSGAMEHGCKLGAASMERGFAP